MKTTGVILAIFALCVFVSADLFTLQGRSSNHISPKGWKQHPRSSNLGAQEVSFTFRIRECNSDQIKSLFWDISNPKSENYAKYMTLEEINSMVVCSEDDQVAVLNYVNSFAVKKVQKIGPTNVKVTCTVAVAEKMLNTQFANFEHNEKKSIVTRQVGTIQLPVELSMVTMITGISDFFDDAKYSAIDINQKKLDKINAAKEKAKNPQYKPVNPTAGQFFDDQLVTPYLLKQIYGIPTTPIESGSTIGIAAFSDDFDSVSLCRFQDLFNEYKEAPNINFEGSNEFGDEVESDLDVQYSTAVAYGAQETFFNQAPGNWIYDWAIATVQNPDRSYVWSISYGFPEIYQCMVSTNVSDPGCGTGVSYADYIEATDTEIAKLGNLGVTVVVSSGDDGSTGFASNCPANPNQPYASLGLNCSDVFPPNADGSPVSCGCNQVIFHVETTVASLSSYSNSTCVWPTGDFFDLDNACAWTGEDALLLPCIYALQGLAEQNTNDCVNSLPFGEIFYSTCQCSQFTAVTNTTGGVTCTASPYTFNPANGPALLPDYPTSSPYVVSVGALGLLPSDSCEATLSDDEIYCTSLDTCAFSGGGGFSSFQAGFAAQTTGVQNYIKNNAASLPPTNAYNGNMRGYPDVALNGHNFMVALNQGSEGTPLVYSAPVGGTSASSPTFGAFVAHLNDMLLSNNKPTLGGLNQLLYTMASESPDTFNDIVPQSVSLLNTTFEFGVNSGCNRAYCCQYSFPVTQGWDAATGLGSPNFVAMSNYISNMYASKK